MLPFPKMRLLINILNFLEKEAQENIAKKVAFNALLRNFGPLYKINYISKKPTISKSEALSNIFDKSPNPQLNKQFAVNGISKFLRDDLMQLEKPYLTDPVILDIERLIGSSRPVPIEYQAAEVHDLLEAFTDIQRSTYKTQGYEYLSEGKYVEAIEAFTIGMGYNKDDVMLISGRSQAHSHLKNNCESLKDGVEAICKDANVPNFYNHVGLVFMDMGRYHLAVGAFCEALQLDPGNDSYKRCLDLATKQLQAEKRRDCTIL